MKLSVILLWLLFHSTNYRPQRSCGQGYVFTRVCDSVHRGCLPQCILRYPPRKEAPAQEGSPPGRWHPRKEAPPQEGNTPPPRRKHPPRKEAPPGRKHPPRHTVNERPVRILLECILVMYATTSWILCRFCLE